MTAPLTVFPFTLVGEGAVRSPQTALTIIQTVEEHTFISESIQLELNAVATFLTLLPGTKVSCFAFFGIEFSFALLFIVLMRSDIKIAIFLIVCTPAITFTVSPQTIIRESVIFSKKFTLAIVSFTCDFTLVADTIVLIPDAFTLSLAVHPLTFVGFLTVFQVPCAVTVLNSATTLTFVSVTIFQFHSSESLQLTLEVRSFNFGIDSSDLLHRNET